MKSTTLFAALASVQLFFSACAQTLPHEIEAREIYAHIVGLRTAAGHDRTAAMAAYLGKTLRAGGVAPSDMAVLTEGEATAMIVRIRGRMSSRPILFSAHMDVVDARPEEWERDPFKLIEENGNFFGRGTIDNKAGVTALVSTILRLKAERYEPARDLVFAFVGDEETGMATTRRIATHPWVKDAEFAINTDAGGGILDEDTGKPLIYLVQGAEKTSATFDLTVTNPGGHSSRPRSDNAIYQLARAVLAVASHRFPAMANELTRSYLQAVGEVQSGALGEALRRFADDPSDASAAEAIANSPEFIGSTRTTCVATRFEAGHASNALPQTAKATVNCRIFPGETVESVQGALSAVIADPDVSVSIRNKPTVTPSTEVRSDVMAVIADAVSATHPGVPVVPYLESAATDGRIYRLFGIPTYATSGRFMKASEYFAHGLNERLPVRAFYDGLDHIYFLASRLGARPGSQPTFSPRAAWLQP